MFTDAHCHPYNLAEHLPSAEDERRRLGVICAASATAMEEFTYCEQLSRQAQEDNAAPLLPCFAIHPQMPAVKKLGMRNEELGMVSELASAGRLAAVGETGFDLYNAAFRETEKIQEELFAVHLEAALRYDLPLVLHVRRAMHKVFANTAALKKCKSVIFHSWPGTAGEGEALLRRGINVFFSFGTAIMLNHREAMRCCAVFPANRLLTETDAPFQPLRDGAHGSVFSGYADLARILETVVALRRQAGDENVNAKAMEDNIADNFHAAFGINQQ